MSYTNIVRAGSRQQAAGSRQQAAGSRQQAAGSRQQAAPTSGNLYSKFFKYQNFPKLSQFSILSRRSSMLLIFAPRLKNLSKISTPLSLTALLLLPCSFDLQALSATTNNLINGTAPYLTFDGGQTKATNTDSLLYIELPDGRSITPSTNTSSLANPIMVPAGITFNDIHMVLPLDSDSISLNDLITQGKWGDDDGDGQGAGGVTASGSISLAIKDKDGTMVSRGDSLDICKAPYKITLSSTEGSLTTQYGVPNRSTFSGGTADYYITLPSQPVICSVRPNLLFGGTELHDISENYYPLSPANIWNPKRGFLVQSTNPSSYDRNFPTTGADGLYFDLDIGGIDVSQLSWSSVTHKGITATVTMVTANESWIPSVDRGKQVARVTLNGPRASRTQISSSNPTPLTPPSLPQTFELVGSDRSGNEVRYGFKLKQWFVNRGDKGDYLSNQTAWCDSLGYRMPKVSDLTNAKCGVDNSNFPCVNSINGATPSSSGNYYMRYIGAGFFTEWGYMDDYDDADFVNYYYWTSDTSVSNEFSVGSDDGDVIHLNVYRRDYVVCTTP